MNASSDPILELRKVAKVYGDLPSGPSVQVLSEVSFSVQRGESVAIVGPSGSGKSTLLNLIGGLDRPTSGTVLIEGKDLGKASEEELARIRNRKIGFVFQSHHLLPQCSVLENVLIPTLVREAGDDPREKPEARGRRLLERVGLSHRLSHRPGQLSGGECQRVAVVRALINEPILLLADEPTGSLDGRNAEDLGNLLVELNREEGVTALVVTHSPELAGKMGRAVEIHSGVVGTTV